MNLYLQMGHGMISMVKELTRLWNGSNVILSPVNISASKLFEHATSFKKIGAKLLFDPQLFYPKEGHNRLKEYPYWPSEFATMSSDDDCDNICRELLKINKKLDTTHIILPSPRIGEIDIDYGLKISAHSANYFKGKTDKPILATICIDSMAIRNVSQLEPFIEKLKSLPVDGYYFIPHHLDNEYIVSDHMWMLGMMKLLSSLKLTKKFVIVGYSNHQGLLYSTAGVDGIASGNFMNTRSFKPSRFKQRYDEDIKKRSTWFYHPSAMSEYKATLLDVAKQRNILSSFKPMGDFLNRYSNMLFTAAMPSSSNYREPDSFKHYLHSLKTQCDILTCNSYQETCDKYMFQLETAEKYIQDYKRQGFSGQNRDFAPALDVNRVAFVTNNEEYGFRLNLDWGAIREING